VARLVYGVHPVREAIRAGRVQALFIAEGDTGQALRQVVDAAKEAAVMAVPRMRPVLDGLARGGNHQGAVAIVGDYVYAGLEEVIEKAKAAPNPLILVLDSIQDPQNLGAIIRTAHVAGVHGIVIPKDRAAAVTPTVVKASAGATEHSHIAQVTNVARALEEMKEQSFWIIGAVAQGGVEPWKVDMKGPVALVLGGEGKGIRPLVLRGCDLLARIPMAGQVASLNVAAAGAILMYEAARQRAA
jgi:23S rRNA (guanosine2251-2'-O)-methyltransferase